MTDISRQLEQLVSISDQRMKIEQYKTALAEYLGKADTGALKAFVEHVAGEAVPLSVSRVVLLELAHRLPSLAPDAIEEIGLFAIDKTLARATSFEEAMSTMREHIAAVFEKKEEWSKAARMLAAIPLESGIRMLDDDFKVEKYIRIAMLYLQVRRGSGKGTAAGWGAGACGIRMGVLDLTHPHCCGFSAGGRGRCPAALLLLP
jgi:COP9 signalosome complex subunit 4